MFHLTEPSAAALDAIARKRGDLPFTQPIVGATRDLGMAAPRGFVVDRYGTDVGRGAVAFDRARRAVRAFAMYPPGWTRIHHAGDDAAIRAGLVFVAVIGHFGFWSALPCRISYVVDEPDSFGFALGTLPGHAECGEERFHVTWDRSTDTVRYDVVAYSRPAAALAWLGWPITRALQKRFARDSCAAMRAASAERTTTPAAVARSA